MNEALSLRRARGEDAEGLLSIYAPIVRETTISFESVLNREYGLYSSTNLVNWVPVPGFECISGNPPINTETGIPLPSSNRGFFRLGAPANK